MRKRVDHAAMPAVGYVVPWSSRAGTRVALHLSSVDPHPRVTVVRLDVDVPRTEDWALRSLGLAVEHGSFDQGSWIELPWNAAAVADGEWALSVEFLLTRNPGTRTLLDGCGVSVRVTEQGHLRVCRAGDTPDIDGTGAHTVEESPALDTQCWYLLELRGSHRTALSVEVRRFATRETVFEMPLPVLTPVPRVRVPMPSGAALQPSPIVKIGAGSHDEPTLNARIGRIRASFDDEEVRWDFPPLGMPEALRPSAGVGPALCVHNHPTFAVKSARWDGSSVASRQNGAHYDAVHLHDDDLGHFEWPASHELEIPAGARSGAYAFEVGTSAGIERIPFFVRPAHPTARLAFLVPTATYVAYGDEYLPRATYPWLCWDRGHQFAQDNRLRSLYDLHDDGSGVSLSSRRRPNATLRDDAMYPLSNCPHLLPVDLQFLRFCGRQNIAIDVLTDHDLHAEGTAALRGYAGLFTGSHPEYWSGAMLTALDAFLADGGHLAYLGGNGFYLSVALDGDLIELRRAPDDELWASDAGEMCMAMNGEPGGYWASQGRPPQALLGSTFLMMGFGPSRPYQRLPASYAREWAWAFVGVGETSIGAAGSVLGAAAGYEVDGVIEQWQQPRGLVRLATADDFDDSFQVRKTLRTALPADAAVPRRADMTVYRHPGGGLVFSVGSVAWCGALPRHGLNAVGAITLNVARYFEER